MKKRLFKIIILLLFISLSFGLNKSLNIFHGTARAVGDLTVDWGVPEGSPIFVVNNFAPGDTIQKDVLIINNADSIRPVGVRGIETELEKNISEKLLIKIFSGSDVYYGGTGNEKTLSRFFGESSGPDGITLFNLSGETDKVLTFEVTFDPSADNDFQDARVVFDLRIGIAINIPVECQGLVFADDPIFGTAGNDGLRGTNKNDLIYAFEGDDKVQSSNGNDCVIGGTGNDDINNSNGNDFIFGNEGNDNLNGSNGNDSIWGGTGNDKLSGSNGSDFLKGEEGDDNLDGSNGNDNIMGGEGIDTITSSNGSDFVDGGKGNDKIDGGNNVDNLFGSEGNDIISGGNGNDSIDGGDGTDSLNGNLGSDVCSGESEISCEL